MPPLGVRDLTMPLAAFGMAIVLTVYVNGTINHTRLQAAVRREEMLDKAREERAKLFERDQERSSRIRQDDQKGSISTASQNPQ